MDADLYLRVRAKEGRLHPDDLVMRLPHVPETHPHALEWRLRAASASALSRHLSRHSRPLAILDLGCGNGWLAARLNQAGHTLLGLDLNRFELAQAARVFTPSVTLAFLEANIFSAPFPPAGFDVIVLASVIQYFASLPRLLQHLRTYLKPQGEIHLIDSPLYEEAELPAAAERSRAYYAGLGFPEMSASYHHHRLSDLAPFAPRFLYRPRRWWVRWFQRPPFPWVVISN